MLNYLILNAAVSDLFSRIKNVFCQENILVHNKQTKFFSQSQKSLIDGVLTCISAVYNLYLAFFFQRDISNSICFLQGMLIEGPPGPEGPAVSKLCLTYL